VPLAPVIAGGGFSHGGVPSFKEFSGGNGQSVAAWGGTEFRIYRWDPDSEALPRLDTCFVDRGECGPIVLDAVI
jgi:hypothetical protein